MSNPMNHKLHLNYAKKLVEEYRYSLGKADHARNLMENHARSLIRQAEKFQKIEDAWIDIEDNGKVDDASNFYDIVHGILSGEPHE